MRGLGCFYGNNWRRPSFWVSLAFTLLLLSLSIQASFSRAVPTGTGQDAPVYPLKLLVYYGYPSLFNGSHNINEAARLFDKYDVVVLGDGLEWENHPEHQSAMQLVSSSKAAFYGYVSTAQDLETVRRSIDAWASMGVRGVFLDEFGFDYLIPRVAGNAYMARLHQREILDYVRSKGLEAAINFWNPEDVFKEVGGVSLNLTGVAVTIEDAVYSFGVKMDEYIKHYYEMVKAAKSAGAYTWCLVTTGANTSFYNKLVGYDALTYIFTGCDAVSIQEDYGEDGNVFYPYSRPLNCTTQYSGVNIPLWGSYPESWLDALLEKLRAMGFNSVQYTVYYEMPSPSSNTLYPSTVTVSDDQLRYAVKTARKMGFKVFLRLGLNVKGGWSGNVNPSNPDEWFKSYRGLALKYARIAEEEHADAFLVGTELTLLQGDPTWRSLIEEIRGVYHGPISYSANWGSEAAVFTDMLDFIGVDAYYPIINSSSWDNIHSTRIAPLIYLYGKPVIFTEIGYRSISKAGLRPWDWESKGTEDQSVQAALWEAFLSKEWPRTCGFFYWAEALWNEGPTGYSVLGKLAENVFKKYLSSRQSTNPQNLSEIRFTAENCSAIFEELEKLRSNYTRCSHDVQRLQSLLETLNKTSTEYAEKIVRLSSTCSELESRIENLERSRGSLEQTVSLLSLAALAELLIIIFLLNFLWRRLRGNEH